MQNSNNNSESITGTVATVEKERRILFAILLIVTITGGAVCVLYENWIIIVIVCILMILSTSSLILKANGNINIAKITALTDFVLTLVLTFLAALVILSQQVGFNKNWEELSLTMVVGLRLFVSVLFTRMQINV